MTARRAQRPSPCHLTGGWSSQPSPVGYRGRGPHSQVLLARGRSSQPGPVGYRGRGPHSQVLLADRREVLAARSC